GGTCTGPTTYGCAGLPSAACKAVMATCTWNGTTCTGATGCVGLQQAACTTVQACTWNLTGYHFIKINTSTIPTFDPTAHPGETIDMVTGSLTEFSGGNLNWTIEARCSDDLVCPASLGCTTQQPIPAAASCVRPRTLADDDEGTN